MLGLYPDFPRNIQRAETFSASISDKKLQQAFVEALYGLNSETFSLEDVAAPSVPDCKTIFEFGVADGNYFNYLDSEERERLLGALNKKPFQVMDFLCVIRYSRMQEDRKKRMRFDYYMMRLLFGENVTEIRVFHERGLMYTSPDDLIKFIERRVNARFSRKVLRPWEPA